KEEKNHLSSWAFWFLSNTLVTLIVGIYLFFAINKGILEFELFLRDEIGQAQVTLEDGVLRTTGLEEPFIFESKEENSVFIVDTKSDQYQEDFLKEYDQGFILKDRIFYSKNNKFEPVSAIPYTEMGQKVEFNITKQKVLDWVRENRNVFISIALVIAICVIWLFFNLLRLLSALWWAFVLWIMALIFNIRNFTYKVSYLAVLNLLFVPLVIELLLKILFNFWFPFETFTICVILFIINLYKLKQDQTAALIKERESVKNADEAGEKKEDLTKAKSEKAKKSKQVRPAKT
ncbi:MAG: DUF1189 domain-containing protein, partial [Candidatus Moranbacteria bacterium]|nr:DUF1189 domain-containing protein [Candidatus Moranbacteria bacterium]